MPGLETGNAALVRERVSATAFSADTIIALLRNQTIASLPEVIAALGAGASRRTAFRKLKDLAARTSYSHRGGYYTLDEIAHFDRLSEPAVVPGSGCDRGVAGPLDAVTDASSD